MWRCDNDREHRMLGTIVGRRGEGGCKGIELRHVSCARNVRSQTFKKKSVSHAKVHKGSTVQMELFGRPN